MVVDTDVSAATAGEMVMVVDRTNDDDLPMDGDLIIK